MSKPIKLTDELLQKIQEEFVSDLKSRKMFDGKIEYKKSLKWNDDAKATVYMTVEAFVKMNALIQEFRSEVAWHGVVHRDENDPFIFYITDILVYPQVVTGATVNTDQEPYQNWLYKFDDDVFNHIRMQGHSHDDMGVTPSGVDTTHQEKILEQIGKDDYYIFMIWNKKLDHYVRIFDLKNNTLYDTDDVDVLIGEKDVDLKAFIKDAKEMVKTKTYTTYQQPQYAYTGPTSYQTPAKVTPMPVQTTPAANGSATAAKPATTQTTGVKKKPKTTGGAGIGMQFPDYCNAGYAGFDDDDGVSFGYHGFPT